MSERQFDEVGWIRGQIIVVIVLFAGVVLGIAMNGGITALMCALTLIPTSTALVANMFEYWD